MGAPVGDGEGRRREEAGCFGLDRGLSCECFLAERNARRLRTDAGE